MSATWTVVLLVGAFTIAFKAAGPVLLGGRAVPARMVSAFELLAPSLLAALVVTQAVGGQERIVLDERLVGLAAAAVAIRFQAPLIVVMDGRGDRHGSGPRALDTRGHRSSTPRIGRSAHCTRSWALPDSRYCRDREEGFVNQSRNLAARMGHWSAHHRKTAIFGWLAFCIVAFGVGSMLGTDKLTASNAGVRESGRMDRLVDREFETPATERVIIQSQTLTVGDAAFKDVVTDVIARAADEPRGDEHHLAARRQGSRLPGPALRVDRLRDEGGPRNSGRSRAADPGHDRRRAGCSS